MRISYGLVVPQLLAHLGLLGSTAISYEPRFWRVLLLVCGR